jgi:uncharacterized protein
MTQKRHARQQINNSLSELSDYLMAASATGGSQLSSYDTIAFTNNYSLISLNRIILTYMYSGCGLFQTAIQLPIQDALAKGIKIESGELDPDDIDEIMDWLEEHEMYQHWEDAWSWVRLYGGGALVMNCDQDPGKPLIKRRLKGAPMEFYDVDRWQLSVVSNEPNEFLLLDDMTSADTLFLNGQQIDRSRVILGMGKRAPAYVRRTLRGWGMSEGERMIRDIQLALKTDDVLFEIIDEAKLDIYHIEGMANKLATAGGAAVIRQRIQEANKIKSYVNALVLDGKEEFEQKSMTFAGLADLKRENRIGVACALRMPMTKLYGLSASGFSTGESDNDNYNEMVESEIRAKIRPMIRQSIEWACWNLWGYCPTFRFSFPSLKVMPELDAAQVNESKMNKILSLYDRGLVSSGKAIGDELAKEEIISAELAAAFVDKPVPPNGSQSVAQAQANTVSVFRQKADDVKNAVKNLAMKNDTLAEWITRKDVK